MPQNSPDNSGTMLYRLQFLTDIIFGLAMTLMVLQFDLPEPGKEMTNLEIKDFLLAQLPALLVYIITFILIAFYWLESLEQFKYYQRTNQVHIWLQLLSLMFIVLIPFSNDLTTFYDKSFPVQVFCSLNLFFVGIFSYFAWLYATTNHRLVPSNLDKKFIFFNGIKALVEPLFSLLAIIPALINPNFWVLTFLLIPVAYLYIEKFNPKVTTKGTK